MCLIILLAMTIGLADLLLPGDGVAILPVSILAVISLVFAIVATVKLVKIQDSFMGGRSLKVNYNVLAVLVFLSLFIMPVPFMYTVI